jgi:hypothetical protein
VHETPLVVADWLPRAMIILQVFTAIFIPLFEELAHRNSMYSI